MNNLNKNIKYINRDFSTFKEQLIEFSKTYFSSTYTDFSEASPGMMFIEQAAYVGDVLSFYLDNQFQETFLQYAQETKNLFELAYMFGYKPKMTTASQVNLDFYQQIPSKLIGTEYVPDYDYAMVLPGALTINSPNNTPFITTEAIDFSFSSSYDPTTVTVYQISNNEPQYFLLKKTRTAISAEIKEIKMDFGDPEPFLTRDIKDSNIIKILDIIDSDGNIWSEVDHLAQEMIFHSIKNTNINDKNINDNTPFLLKLKKVATRFTSRFIDYSHLQIQFGAGSPQDITEEILPNINNVGIGLPFKQDKLTTAFSPTNFLHTGTYGISPSNTTLNVRYLKGGGVQANVSANTLIDFNSSKAQFIKQNLNPTISQYIISSLSVNNPTPATGGKGGDTLQEIRFNSLALVSSQKRSVTADDYLIRALSMPSEYGSISKVYIEQPKLTDYQVSTIRTLCLYILSLNSSDQLEYANLTLKNNLKTYLSQYRMIGDNIEIKDAYIINIGVNFEIVVLPEYNNNEVLLVCIASLKNYFLTNRWQLNQPIIISDLYVLLDKIVGVQTVKDIFITNKSSTLSGYSQYSYDIEAATQNKTIYPSLDPSIFEIRYPNRDIIGRVVSL